jgi:hypothetical protein
MTATESKDKFIHRSSLFTIGNQLHLSQLGAIATTGCMATFCEVHLEVTWSTWDEVQLAAVSERIIVVDEYL